MTQEEFTQAALACDHFLPGHYPRSVAKRMREIAESPYAEFRSDMYGNGGFVSVFEQELAELFEKEACVVMPSGTMAQQIALRIWADQAGNKNVAFHPMSHLHTHEHMAYRELHHLEPHLLGEADRLFTLEDLQAYADIPLSSVLIELPQRDLGGQLPTWEELGAITRYAHDRGTKCHLDGARLWECQPYYGRPLAEIVADFDSVYVSFYKILGGLPGAALLGPTDFIAEARIWMRRHGGNLPYMFPNAIAAKLGMEKHLPRMAEYVAKAAEVAAIFASMPGVRVNPAKPKTNMMHLHFSASKEAMRDAFGEIAVREKVLLVGWLADDGEGCKTELSIGEAALDLPEARIRELLAQALASS